MGLITWCYVYADIGFNTNVLILHGDIVMGYIIVGYIIIDLLLCYYLIKR